MQVADRYKVSPWEVWNHWPVWFLQGSSKAIPLLRAQESFRHAEEVAVGAGQFKHKHDRTRILRRWAQDVKGSLMPKTKSGFEKMMMGLGMMGRIGGNSGR